MEQGWYNLAMLGIDSTSKPTVKSTTAENEVKLKPPLGAQAPWQPVQTTNGTASAHCPSTGDSCGFSPFGMLFVHRPFQLKTAHLMFATRQEQSEDWSTCVVCDPSSEASRCTTWSTWIPDGKTNKKLLQVKYYGVHSSVTTKQLGAPHGTENGSFHFGSLCLLQTLVLCQSVFKMQWSALHGQVASESSATFTTLINERSSFITSCAILRKSKLCSTKVTTKHWSHTTPTSVISIKTSFNSGTLDNLRNGKKTTKKHHLWIKWVNWSILRLTLSIDSFHFSLYKSFVTPLSFPTYLTAQQEAYHIQPPEVLPRTLVLVPCEKASHGFFHSSSGYKVYIPMYICNTIYNLYIYSLFHTQYLGFRLS